MGEDVGVGFLYIKVKRLGREGFCIVTGGVWFDCNAREIVRKASGRIRIYPISSHCHQRSSSTNLIDLPK